MICINFKYLNKVYSMVCYTLLRIDHMIYSTLIYLTLSFLDAISSYNQATKDVINIAFQINFRNWYYKVIKRACATYWWLISKFLTIKSRRTSKPTLTTSSKRLSSKEIPNWPREDFANTTKSQLGSIPWSVYHIPRGNDAKSIRRF